MKAMKSGLFLGTVAAIALMASQAGAWIIDFSEDDSGSAFGHGDVIAADATKPVKVGSPGSDIFAEVSVENPHLSDPDYSAIYDSATLYAEDPDLYIDDPESAYKTGESLPSYPDSLGNLAIIQENPADCGTGTCSSPDDEGDRGDSGAGTLMFEFSAPVRLYYVDFVDIDDEETTGKIKFQDTSGTWGGWDYSIPTTGNGQWVRWSAPMDWSAIKGIQFMLAGSGGIATLAGTEVAEPGSLALIAFGMGAVYLSRRRRS